MDVPKKADTSLLAPNEDKPLAALKADLRWSEATGKGDDRLSPDAHKSHKDTHGSFLSAHFVHSTDRSVPLGHDMHKTSALRLTAQALMGVQSEEPTGSALRKTAQQMIKVALHPGAAAGLGALAGAPVGLGLSAAKQGGEMSSGEREGMDPYLLAKATILGALLGGGGGVGLKYAPEILSKGRQAGEALNATVESGPAIRQAAQELMPELQAAAGATTRAAEQASAMMPGVGEAVGHAGRAADRVANESILRMLFKGGSVKEKTAVSEALLARAHAERVLRRLGGARVAGEAETAQQLSRMAERAQRIFEGRLPGAGEPVYTAAPVMPKGGTGMLYGKAMQARNEHGRLADTARVLAAHQPEAAHMGLRGGVATPWAGAGADAANPSAWLGWRGLLNPRGIPFSSGPTPAHTTRVGKKMEKAIIKGQDAFDDVAFVG
jgi:hypothetical protein